jgi:hypothetical protein
MVSCAGAKGISCDTTAGALSRCIAPAGVTVCAVAWQDHAVITHAASHGMPLLVVKLIEGSPHLVMAERAASRAIRASAKRHDIWA